MKVAIILVLIAALFSVWGCEQALEDSLEGQTVTLLAPVNGLTTNDSIHLFYWSPVRDADNYQLQIVSPRFDSIVRLRLDTIVKLNQIPVRLIRGNYQWRVKAQNSGSSSRFSSINNLTIQ